MGNIQWRPSKILWSLIQESTIDTIKTTFVHGLSIRDCVDEAYTGPLSCLKQQKLDGLASEHQIRFQCPKICLGRAYHQLSYRSNVQAIGFLMFDSFVDVLRANNVPDLARTKH